MPRPKGSRNKPKTDPVPGAPVPAPATGVGQQPTAQQNYLQILQGPRMTDAIKRVLPDYVDAARFVGMALEAAKAFAASKNVIKESILIAVFQAAKLGLMFDTFLGHAYLVPFKTKTGKALITMIPGYKGLIHLAKNSSDRLVDIRPVLVYQKDEFKQWTDEDGFHFRHEPSNEKEPGERMGVYCLYWLAEEDKPRYHWTSAKKILAIKRSAISRGGAVWKTWEDAMWLKTGVRQTMKLLELSPVLSTAIARDERMEAGIVDTSIPDEISDLVPTTYTDEAVAANAETQQAEGGKPVVEAPKEKPAAETVVSDFESNARDLAQKAGIKDLDSWIQAEFSFASVSLVTPMFESKVIDRLLELTETSKAE